MLYKNLITRKMSSSALAAYVALNEAMALAHKAAMAEKADDTASVRAAETARANAKIAHENYLHLYYRGRRY